MKKTIFIIAVSAFLSFNFINVANVMSNSDVKLSSLLNKALAGGEDHWDPIDGKWEEEGWTMCSDVCPEDSDNSTYDYCGPTNNADDECDVSEQTLCND